MRKKKKKIQNENAVFVSLLIRILVHFRRCFGYFVPCGRCVLSTAPRV